MSDTAPTFGKQRGDGGAERQATPQPVYGDVADDGGLVGYLLGEDWTQPVLANLSITSDGFVTSMDDFFGPVGELEGNLARLAAVAELTADERRELAGLYAEKVGDWRNPETLKPPTPFLCTDVEETYS